MKKVILAIALTLTTGCGEVYLKAGHRFVDEHQESQKSSIKPLKCYIWADCSGTAVPEHS